MTRTQEGEAKGAEEAQFAAGLEGRGTLSRYGSYLRRGGPGYLQSAMTLGGGTAMSSLFAGRMFGYELLWVAPVGMLIGVLMLGVLAKLTLTTDERPYAAVKRHAGAGIALAWALGTIIASIVWHFPQYALAGDALADVADVADWSLSPAVAAFPVLGVALVMSFLYGRSAKLVRAYETLVKLLVVGIIVCFALVVGQTAGETDWGAVMRGFIPSIPDVIDIGPDEKLSPLTLIAAGLSSAVGINMVFLYPYSIRARGWGKDHVECARFDLFAGMLVPYMIAASLVVIATANTIEWQPGDAALKLKPIEAAQAFGRLLGPTTGRLVFDLGLIGMALSTIALHMIACGFAVGEITGKGPQSRAYRLGTLLPIPGVLGPVLWKSLLWLSIPTSIVCGLFLPLAYVGIILWAKRSDAIKSRATVTVMAIVTALFTAVLLSHLYGKVTN